MKVDTYEQGSALVVRVYGERLDIANSREFKNEMIEIITAGASRLVLDLSSVNLLDSSGLTSIASTLKALGPNGRIAVGAITKPVEKVFQLTRMYKIIPIFNSIDEAEASMASSPRTDA